MFFDACFCPCLVLIEHGTSAKVSYRYASGNSSGEQSLTSPSRTHESAQYLGQQLERLSSGANLPAGSPRAVEMPDDSINSQSPEAHLDMEINRTSRASTLRHSRPGESSCKCVKVKPGGMFEIRALFSTAASLDLLQ